MYEVIFPHATMEDFTRIYEHYTYERSNPELAEKIDTNIRNTIKSRLKNLPDRGRSVGIGIPKLRVYQINKQYWVIYSHDETTVFVHRIVACKEFRTAGL